VINYFCCNLYCIVLLLLLLLCYAQSLILETFVCNVSFVLFVLCFFFPDKFHVRLLSDRICGPVK